MVLDMVFRFCCRNGGGRIYKIIGFAFDTWQGNAPFSHDDSHLICLVFCHLIAFTFFV